MALLQKFRLAGARGIEPRSKVLETFILTVIRCPYGVRTRADNT